LFRGDVRDAVSVDFYNFDRFDSIDSPSALLALRMKVSMWDGETLIFDLESEEGDRLWSRVYFDSMFLCSDVEMR
jgi:hypothetical protein